MDRVLYQVEAFIRANGWKLPVTYLDGVITVGVKTSAGALTCYTCSRDTIEHMGYAQAVQAIKYGIKKMHDRLETAAESERLKREVREMYGGNG